MLLILGHLIGFLHEKKFDGSTVRLKKDGSMSPAILSGGQEEIIQDPTDGTLTALSKPEQVKQAQAYPGTERPLVSSAWGNQPNYPFACPGTTLIAGQTGHFPFPPVDLRLASISAPKLTHL